MTVQVYCPLLLGPHAFTKVWNFAPEVHKGPVNSEWKNRQLQAERMSTRGIDHANHYMQRKRPSKLLVSFFNLTCELCTVSDTRRNNHEQNCGTIVF